MKTCGVLCVARVEEQPVIVEFTSFQDTKIIYLRSVHHIIAAYTNVICPDEGRVHMLIEAIDCEE